MRTEWKQGVLRTYKTDTYETLAVDAPVWFADDFMGSAVNGDIWASTGVNSGAAAMSAETGGLVRITTGTADNDDLDLATGLNFNSGDGCCMEFRLRDNDVSGMAWCAGFSDSQTEAADKIAIMHGAVAAGTGAYLYMDGDSADYIVRGAVVNSTAAGTAHTAAAATTDAGFVVGRIECDPTAGVTDFYVNGVHIGQSTATPAATSDLCVYIGAINREGAANTLDVDYVKAWQTGRA